MTKNEFTKRESVMKWNRILGSLAVGAMFWACSDNDGKNVAGGASGDAGIVAVKDLDVAGLAQKGPFVNGSEVTVQGIDCKTMEFTEEEFTGKVKGDKGDFTIEDVSLKSSCALFEVTGIYRSEITGKKTSRELTLRALTDLKDRKNVNINLLTELEYERIMYLVTEKKMTFAKAKEQAEKEVLAAFDIAGSFEDFENLNIFESGDENAALLAVSVMMLAETDDAGLAKRMEKFADSFAETGKWKDSDTKTAISEWAVEATANGVLDSVRKNVEAWNDGDKVAAFEKFIEAYADDDSVVLSSSSSSSSKVSESAEVTTKSMMDTRDGKTYKTVKIGEQVWMAENLDYETDSSFCYNDSTKYCAKYGRLYTWSAAMNACPDGWHLPSETDFKNLIKAVGGEKDAATKLKSTSGWNDYDGGSGNGTDAFGFSALPAGGGNAGSYGGDGYTTDFWGSTECGTENSPEPGTGCAYAIYLDYDEADVNLSSYAAKDLVLSVRCIKGDPSTAPVRPSSSSSVDETKSSSSSAISSSSAVVSSSSVEVATPCKTETEDNCEYGALTDIRDGQTYKTVKIGGQVWMAENLNYADSTKTPSLKGKSWCYNNDLENCAIGGRLYTWAAAIDSVTLANDVDNPQDCGYGKTCSLPAKVQGVCPSGWHLPTYPEWNVLFAAVGGRLTAGQLFKSQTGWDDDGNGTDAFGFTVLPVGYRDYDGGFNDDGGCAYFWSAKEIGDNAYRMYLYYSVRYTDLSLEGKDYGFSVRCVKD